MKTRFAPTIKGEGKGYRENKDKLFEQTGLKSGTLPQQFNSTEEAQKWIDDNDLNSLLYPAEWGWI